MSYKILRLQTQGFKRVTAVDITPDGPLVEVRGNNAEGKSSLLDSIMTALGGASITPIKPIRTGDDFAAIRVELGDNEPAIIVEKYFDDVGEKLRVTNAEGAQFTKGQTEVDKLLGRMTFDPLAFSRLNAADQAAELRRIAPLKVDLDQLAVADKADTLARRDVNRAGKDLAARVEAIEVSGIVPPQPDRDAIMTAISTAGDVNAKIADERARREVHERERQHTLNGAFGCREEAKTLREKADQLDQQAARFDEQAAAMAQDAEAWPALAELVDTAKLSADLAQADRDLALLGRIAERKRLSEELETLRARSRGFTEAMQARAAERSKALAEAEMPVPGLGLARRCDVIANDESEDLIVMFEGEPFAQASSAQQLRVSMRLAMATNPKLRVMLIKDGSLLDPNGLALVRELAAGGNYQVWIESVGEGDGTGIIMEAGAVRGAPTPEPIEPPKRRRAKPDEPAAEATPSAPPVDDGNPPPFETSAKLVEGSDGLARTPARRKPSDLRRAPATDLFNTEN